MATTVIGQELGDKTPEGCERNSDGLRACKIHLTHSSYAKDQADVIITQPQSDKILPVPVIWVVLQA